MFSVVYSFSFDHMRIKQLNKEETNKRQVLKTGWYKGIAVYDWVYFFVGARN